LLNIEQLGLGFVHPLLAGKEHEGGGSHDGRDDHGHHQLDQRHTPLRLAPA
jgi:hypothetical protein